MDSVTEEVSMSPGNAHGDSLPLFAYLQMFEGMPVGDAIPKIRSALETLHLTSHVEVVIVLRGEGEKVKSVLDIEARTVYGLAVLGEVEARAEFLPCPEGECEYADDTCRWCGNVRSS